MPSFALGQLAQEVLSALDGNSLFFPLYSITEAVNEGLYRLNLLIGFSQDIVPVPGFSKPMQLEYFVPAPVIVPIRVFYENRELQKLSIRELGQSFRSWAVDSNDKHGPVSHWAPIGIRQFVIHPMDKLGGQMLEVEGITSSPELTAENQIITLDDEWADLLVDYAKTRVLLKDSTVAFSQASAAYQDWIRKIKLSTLWADLKFPNYYILKVLEPVQKMERVV